MGEANDHGEHLGMIAADLKLSTARSPLCAICREDATKADLCYGCKHYVCGRCDALATIGGVHELAAHLGAIYKARRTITGLGLHRVPGPKRPGGGGTD